MPPFVSWSNYNMSYYFHHAWLWLFPMTKTITKTLTRTILTIPNRISHEIDCLWFLSISPWKETETSLMDGSISTHFMSQQPWLIDKATLSLGLLASSGTTVLDAHQYCHSDFKSQAGMTDGTSATTEVHIVYTTCIVGGNSTTKYEYPYNVNLRGWGAILLEHSLWTCKLIFYGNQTMDYFEFEALSLIEYLLLID